MKASAYVVEVRRPGASEWRPVKAYLSRAAATKKALAAQWEDHVEARVCVCVALPDETIICRPVHVATSHTPPRGKEA